jgi:regulator of protease activity HflC (stomatin/prohibitin superfamily)
MGLPVQGDVRRLLVTAAVLLLIGALAVAVVGWATGDVSFYVLAAALLLAAGGFTGEATLAQARSRPAHWLSPVRYTVHRRVPAWAGWWVGRVRHLRKQIDETDWFGAWLHVLLAFLGGMFALLILAATWRASMAGASWSPLRGGILVVAAFPLLLLQRILASAVRTGRFLAAPRLDALLRVPLTVSIGLGAAELIGSLGYTGSDLVRGAAIILIGVVAAEVILRSLSRVFLPVPALAVRGTPADSRVAALIRPEWPRAGAVGRAMRREFGIDLSRSWAFAFVLRAAVPLGIGFVVIGWLLTGLTVLGIDQRGVYERFGVPVSVQGPGLHMHMPWPFGVVRKVELGVVHEIPIVFPSAAGTGIADATDTAVDIGAEAAPPPSVDRLWDDMHPSEASYLIASEAKGTQGFQIVNIDLRVVYRVQPSDAGAMAAIYRVDDAESLIRALAGRMLVRHFSRYTLNDVLGENRASFVGAFREELQSRLDGLQSGTEIMAVVVEAIHPPPAAARAYHNVQAAQIKALARVSESRGSAFTERGRAAQVALQLHDEATGDAAEQLGEAKSAETLFSADHQGYREGGSAFLTERWLGHLQSDLARSPLVIVDHRLQGADAPTVDLRSFARPGDTPTAGYTP